MNMKHLRETLPHAQLKTTKPFRNKCDASKNCPCRVYDRGIYQGAELQGSKAGGKCKPQERTEILEVLLQLWAGEALLADRHGLVQEADGLSSFADAVVAHLGLYGQQYNVLRSGQLSEETHACDQALQPSSILTVNCSVDLAACQHTCCTDWRLGKLRARHTCF